MCVSVYLSISHRCLDLFFYPDRRVMEAAIQTMVKVFLKSSKGKESLGKKEFQTLVRGQLSNILSVRTTPFLTFLRCYFVLR